MDIDPTNNIWCVTVKKPNDVAINKTGELRTSPVGIPGGGASFNLAVTNVGNPFNGTNVIQVTDVVPPGMTFTAATGPNWTCAALPATAGQTITCTYSGPGPTTIGQSLGNIAVTATTTGDGPWENCAVVGILPASGTTDSDPTNNKSCVTLKKPPQPNNVTVQKILDPSAESSCTANFPCKFQIKVTNNSPWPFNGPVVFSDTTAPAMNVVATDLPCTPQPTSIPFACTGNVSLPAGPSSHTYFVTGVIPGGSVLPSFKDFNAKNCMTVSNPPPVPGAWSTLVSSQQGCVTFLACGYGCHMSDFSW